MEKTPPASKKYLKGAVFTVLLLVFYAFLILPLNHFVNGSNFFIKIQGVKSEQGQAVSHQFYGLFSLNEESKSAYIGGFPVAMALYTDGVIIEEILHVDTPFGRATPAAALNRGDFLTELNGKKIKKVSDIDEILASLGDNKITAEIIRNGSEKQIELAPAKEEFSGKYRLGLTTRDHILGIGMVSYVNEDGSFGALGHPVTDSVGGRVPIRGGHIFACEEIGVVKGQKGKPGELRVRITSLSNPVGEIYSNTSSGVFGKFTSQGFLAKAGCKSCENKLSVVGRKKVSPGSAHIRSTIGGVTDLYKIEIIKASSQNSPCEKGLVFRVTDKRLLEKTGGIVQGMSGSPIVQNNMIVGAVTHVFVSDPSKGYGIYLDWMKG